MERLTNLAADFAVETIVSTVSMTYKMMGPQYVSGDAFMPLTIPYLVEYFNVCAVSLMDHSDEYLNERFNEMTINMKYDSVCLLKDITILIMDLLTRMQIRDIVGEYDTTLKAVRAHLWFLVRTSTKKFKECDHEPLSAFDVPVFSVDTLSKM